MNAVLIQVRKLKKLGATQKVIDYVFDNFYMKTSKIPVNEDVVSFIKTYLSIRYDLIKVDDKSLSDGTELVIEMNSRKRPIVEARQIGMTLLKKYTKHTLAEIGYMMGGKDHATVLHAVKTINNLISTDKCFADNFSVIDKDVSEYIKKWKEEQIKRDMQIKAEKDALEEQRKEIKLNTDKIIIDDKNHAYYPERVAAL